MGRDGARPAHFFLLQLRVGASLVAEKRGLPAAGAALPLSTRLKPPRLRGKHHAWLILCRTKACELHMGLWVKQKMKRRKTVQGFCRGC